MKCKNVRNIELNINVLYKFIHTAPLDKIRHLKHLRQKTNKFKLTD